MSIIRENTVTTRKPHICSACGRRFEKGAKMKVQISIYDGSLCTWRNCKTCDELLTKFPDKFVDDWDNVFYHNCVDESLEPGHTPEDLLKALKGE